MGSRWLCEELGPSACRDSSLGSTLGMDIAGGSLPDPSYSPGPGEPHGRCWELVNNPQQLPPPLC